MNAYDRQIIDSIEIPITDPTVISILAVPPNRTINAPNPAPAIICQAPVKPEPVPAYLPAADIAPIVAFDIRIPF